MAGRIFLVRGSNALRVELIAIQASGAIHPEHVGVANDALSTAALGGVIPDRATRTFRRLSLRGRIAGL